MMRIFAFAPRKPAAQTLLILLERVGETPEALRDLSISLNNVGNTAQAQGRWEQARQAFEEGLAIGQVLSAALPDIVEYNGLAEWFRERLEKLQAESG
jgi:hypothetical protein